MVTGVGYSIYKIYLDNTKGKKYNTISLISIDTKIF